MKSTNKPKTTQAQTSNTKTVPTNSKPSGPSKATTRLGGKLGNFTSFSSSSLSLSSFSSGRFKKNHSSPSYEYTYSYTYESDTTAVAPKTGKSSAKSKSKTPPRGKIKPKSKPASGVQSKSKSNNNNNNNNKRTGPPKKPTTQKSYIIVPTTPTPSRVVSKTQPVDHSSHHHILIPTNSNHNHDHDHAHTHDHPSAKRKGRENIRYCKRPRGNRKDDKEYPLIDKALDYYGHNPIEPWSRTARAQYCEKHHHNNKKDSSHLIISSNTRYVRKQEILERKKKVMAVKNKKDCEEDDEHFRSRCVHHLEWNAITHTWEITKCPHSDGVCKNLDGNPKCDEDPSNNNKDKPNSKTVVVVAAAPSRSKEKEMGKNPSKSQSQVLHPTTSQPPVTNQSYSYSSYSTISQTEAEVVKVGPTKSATVVQNKPTPSAKPAVPVQTDLPPKQEKIVQVKEEQQPIKQAQEKATQPSKETIVKKETTVKKNSKTEAAHGGSNSGSSFLSSMSSDSDKIKREQYNKHHFRTSSLDSRWGQHSF